jgi:hypothetical protein
MEVPACLTENYGLDSAGTVLQLTEAHADGFDTYGISECGCCDKVCFELVAAKSSVVNWAYEVVSLTLWIDEQVAFKEIAKFHKK